MGYGLSDALPFQVTDGLEIRCRFVVNMVDLKLENNSLQKSMSSAEVHRKPVKLVSCSVDQTNGSKG